MRDSTLARDTVDDIYVRKAIEFISKHEKQHPNQPFFMYLALNAIHGAVDVPKRFRGKTKIGIREDKIPWINESVGKMLTALDDLDVADETLVIFTSDNGPLDSQAAKQKGHQPTGPYRGVKSNVYDGGTRVPFLARWPGKISAGGVSDHLLCLTDILATVAKFNGTSLDAAVHPDSISQASVLLQKGEAPARSNLVTLSFGGFYTYRRGSWKAVFGTKWTGGHDGDKYGGVRPKSVPPDGPEIGQLFKVDEDPHETTDVWDQHPEVVQHLRHELQQIRDAVEDDHHPWQRLTEKTEKLF